MALAVGALMQHPRAARRKAYRDLVGQPLARRNRVVPVSHDDGRIAVIDVQLRLGNGLVMLRGAILEGFADGGIALAQHVRVSGQLGALGLVARRQHALRGRPALRLVAVQQTIRALAAADQRKLPGQVDGVVQAAIHAMALGRTAGVRGVSGQQDATGPELPRDFGVATEARRMGHVLEIRLGQIAPQRGQGIGHQIGVFGSRPQIHAPALARQRRQDHRDPVQVGVIGLEDLGPAADRGVEHRPRLADVVTVLLDAGQLAHRAVVAVAAYHPLGQHFDCPARLLDPGQHAVRPFLQIHQLAGPLDGAAVAGQIVAEDGLRDLFRNPDVVGVAAAAKVQIDLAQHLAVGMDARAALLHARGQQRLDDAQRIEDLQRAGVDHRCAVPFQRPLVRIDQQALHAAPLQLGGGEQARRTGAHHQDCRCNHHDVASRNFEATWIAPRHEPKKVRSRIAGRQRY